MSYWTLRHLTNHAINDDDFGLSNSVPLRGRAIEQTVRWTTRSNWSKLAGRKVRLRIRLRNADLYAFWTAKEE